MPTDDLMVLVYDRSLMERMKLPCDLVLVSLFAEPRRLTCVVSRWRAFGPAPGAGCHRYIQGT